MRLRVPLLVCLAAAAIAGGRQRTVVAAEPAKGARLKVDFNAKGISALSYGTTNLLADGSFLVERAVFRKPDGSESVPALKPDSRCDARRRVLTTRFPWGSVTCTYVAESDRLKFH